MIVGGDGKGTIAIRPGGPMTTAIRQKRGVERRYRMRKRKRNHHRRIYD